MSDDQARVLIVDDSGGDIRIVNENLKGHYITLAATSGERALQLLEKDPKPDVILMDVEMPGLTGYETCEKLKSNPDTQDIDVIFVSSHDTADAIISGYDAGGTDYLTKPIEPQELKRKIDVTVENRKLREAMSNAKKNVENIAMTALTSAGEQGVVIEFLRASFNVSTTEELAELIVSSIHRYDLDNAVQIRSPKKIDDKASNGCVVPLEQELLLRLKDQNRIIEKGRRAVFNFGDISLLVKNVSSDSDKWGRLRDHLALLLEGAEARHRAILVTESVSDVIHNSNQALEEISNKQRAHKEVGQQIVDKMLCQLEDSFNTLGLSDAQETMLLTLIQSSVNESLVHYEKSMEFDGAIQDIVSQLTEI